MTQQDVDRELKEIDIKLDQLSRNEAETKIINKEELIKEITT